jgi:hypothetical protein
MPLAESPAPTAPGAWERVAVVEATVKAPAATAKLK